MNLALLAIHFFPITGIYYLFFFLFYRGKLDWITPSSLSVMNKISII